MKTYSHRKAIGCVSALVIATLVSQSADAQHHHHHHRPTVHHGGLHSGYYSGHHHHSHALIYGAYGYPPVYASGYATPQVIYSAPAPVVQNAIPSNSLPAATPLSLASDPGTITIVNPSESGGEISYALNGTSYTIKPGQTQTIQNDRPWTIAFGSGGAAGDVRYSLNTATYRFKVTKVGWNLFKADEVAATTDYPPAPTPQFDVVDEEPRSVLIPIT